MTARPRPMLRSKFWQSFLSSVRCCYACGGRLRLRYVREEQCRRRVCVRCGAITYLNPKMVAGIIPVSPDGRIALLRRNIEPARGKWSYPAGFQEMGESTPAAAVREAKEEMGISVRLRRLVGLYSYSAAGVVTAVYEGRIGPRATLKTTHEALEVALFKPKGVPWKDLAFRSTRDALKDWMLQNETGTRSPVHSAPIKL